MLTHTPFRLSFSLRTDSKVAEVLSWAHSFNSILVRRVDKPCTDLVRSRSPLVKLLELNYCLSTEVVCFEPTIKGIESGLA